MDGSAVLLEDFASALNTGDGGRRVRCVQYPRNAHLGFDALARYVQEEYIHSLPNDDRGVAVVSQSYSAHVGLRLHARAHVFVNGFAGPPLRSSLPLWRLFPPQLFRMPPPPWLAAPLFLGRDSAAMRKVQLEGSRVDPAVMALRLRDCLVEDSWHRWRNAEALTGSSTLYLCGKSDPIVGNNQIASAMRQARDDIAWVDVPDGPHLLLQSNGPQCANAIDNFLANLLNATGNIDSNRD